MRFFRSLLGRALGALVMIVALCGPARAQVQELEPNDTCLAPQLGGAIDPPASVVGNLDPLVLAAQTDVDFFRFTATPGIALRVRVGPGRQLGLFDAQCRLVAATGPLGSPFIDLDVPPSGMFVVAVADPFDNGFTGNGFLQGGPYQLDLTLPPPRIGSISGRLVDARSGEPLMGAASPFARVELRRCDATGCFEFVNDQLTDARGMFRFELDQRGRPIETGSFELAASASEYQSVSVQLSVGEDEGLDIGDVALIPPPILFSDIRPCTAILPQGGVCAYSARIRNNTTARLTGLAHSLVDAGFGASRFEATTRRSGSDVRRAPVRIPAGGSQVVHFLFDVPSFVANGTVICADLDLGLDPHPLFNGARRANLFCMSKGDSGFRLMSPLESGALFDGREPGRQSTWPSP